MSQPDNYCPEKARQAQQIFKAGFPDEKLHEGDRLINAEDFTGPECQSRGALLISIANAAGQVISAVPDRFRQSALSMWRQSILPHEKDHLTGYDGSVPAFGHSGYCLIRRKNGNRELSMQVGMGVINPPPELVLRIGEQVDPDKMSSSDIAAVNIARQQLGLKTISPTPHKPISITRR